MFIIMMTPSVSVALSHQNNLYEFSYCNSLDTSILSLKSLYNSLDFDILEKSFPSPWTTIKFPRSRGISLSLGTLSVVENAGPTRERRKAFHNPGNEGSGEHEHVVGVRMRLQQWPTSRTVNV